MTKSNREQVIWTSLILMTFVGIPSVSNAQWWNPLEPKDSNECIIKNMKEGMGEDAVRALQYACIQRYPAPKATATEIASRSKLDERYKKCGLDRYHYKNHMYFALDGRNKNKTNEILNKLQSLKYNPQTNAVSFQNMSSVSISGVMLGFTSKKQCLSDTESYDYTTYCNTGSTETGVGQNSYGSMRCGALPKESKTMGTCKIGYSPFYNQFNESLLDYFEISGYCN